MSSSLPLGLICLATGLMSGAAEGFDFGHGDGGCAGIQVVARGVDGPPGGVELVPQGWTVRGGIPLDWQVASASEGLHAVLPRMITDIVMDPP